MNIIDALVVTLGLDPSNFESGANRAKKAEKGLNDELDKNKKKTEDNNKAQEKANKGIIEYAKQLQNLKKNLLEFAGVYASVRIFKRIIEDVSESESELYKLSQRLDTSAQDLQAWGNAAAIMGGNADEARAGLQALSSDLTALRYKGEMSGRLMFLSQMGVSATDATGKAKDLLQIQQDLGDSFDQQLKSGRMGKDQFANLASQAGYDNSTIQLLMAEKSTRDKILAQQREYNKLSQENAKDSFELRSSWTDFKLQLMALRQSIFHTFEPFLKFLVDGAIKVMHLINSFPKLTGAVAGFGLAAAPLFGLLRLFTAFGGGAGATLFRIGMALARLADIAVKGGGALVRLWASLRTGISLFMRLNAVLKLLRNPIVALIAIVGFLIKDLRDFGNNGKSLVPWASIFDGIHDVIEWFGNLSDKIGDVWDKLQNHDWSGAWQSLKGIFDGGSDEAGGGNMATIASSAAADLGVSESNNRNAIMGYQQAIGYGANGIAAWCASFVGAKLEQAGFKSTRSASAASYLNYGTAADMNKSIQSGSVGVLRRNGGSGYHVDIIEKDNGDGTVTTIDGNWGKAVKRVIRKKSDFASIRIPVAKDVQAIAGTITGKTQGQGYNDYDALIQQAAVKYGISASLIKGVMHTESHFNPNARSPAGALGLMQTMPGTFRRFNQRRRANPFNPADSIEAGANYLSYLSKRYGGNMTKVIAAYNAGEGNVDKYNGTPPFKETQAYVQRVTQNARAARFNGGIKPMQVPRNSPRQLSAMGNNSSNWSASNHNEVSIGQVVIHTQATDAQGIARSMPAALTNSMAGLAFNLDMGQA